MSEANVKLALAAVDAVARMDLERLIELTDPEADPGAGPAGELRLTGERLALRQPPRAAALARRDVGVVRNVAGQQGDANGNNFWGVEVFQHANQEYVAASDRDSGLWIFRYTGG